MPWQAQLFIGVVVHDNDEVREIFQKFGYEADETKGFRKLEGLNAEELEEELYECPYVKRSITFKGERIEVKVQFLHETEGGAPWPVGRGEEDSCALVGFSLTSRYRPAILDRGHEHGRPEPFEIDPQDILEILASVHEWWPEARFLMMDCFY